MKRSSSVAAGVFFLAGVLLAADQPTKKTESVKPPWQRVLGVEDAKKAAQWEKQRDQLQEAGNFAEALKPAEEVARLRAKAQGADHWQAVDARFDVDATRRVLRAQEADRQSYVRMFAVSREAEALVAKGHFREAQLLLEQVLGIRQKVLGTEHPFMAKYYLPLAYSQFAQGRFAEAEGGCRKALEVCLKTLGEEHPLTAASHLNLADSLRGRSSYKDAEEHFRQALAIQLRVLGEEQIDTATTYNNLAGTLRDQSKYKEAEGYYRKALAIFSKLRGEDHPDTAAIYLNLGSFLGAQGNFKEAEENCRKALAITRKVLGEDHPQTAASYLNLADSLYDLGRYVEAEGNYRKSLAICVKVLGEDNPQTSVAYMQLANNLNDQGRYKDAEEGYLKALAIRRKVLGEEHDFTAASYSGLASNLTAQGRYEEAEGYNRKALAVYLKVLGEGHIYMAMTYNNLALIHSRQGRLAEAEDGYRKALTINLKALGEEHPDTATNYVNLASALAAQGKHEEAEDDLRKALAINHKVRGEQHHFTAINYNSLGYHQYAQGRFKQAESSYRAALTIDQKVLGEHHPETAGLYLHLAHSLHAQGEYKEAEKFGRSAADSFREARLGIAAAGLDRATITSEGSPLPFLAAVLARNGEPAAAWQRFEEGLARGTWDDLTARLRRSDAERSKQTQLVARIDRLNKIIEKPISIKQPVAEQTKQREELLIQLRQAQDDLAAFTHQLEQKYGPVAGEVLKRQQIQAALPGDAALIGWLDLAGHAKAKDPNGEHWAILLRSSGAPIWVRLRGSGDKDDWTNDDTQLSAELRAALEKPRRQWQPLAERLRQQRLQPLAKHLPGVRRLIVLPSTALAGVPIEVIADGYTVSYAHSGSMYAYLRQQRTPTGKGLFVLADPVFESPAAAEKTSRDDGWKRLPGTRVEAASLHRLFARDEPASVLLDSDASEQRLNELAQNGELGKYRYIHLATHGEVDNTAPLRSAVILARDRLPDDRQRTELLLSGRPIPDGRLTAEEVLRRWNLHCDLVTLSACQTALGKYERGEGFVGFAQAFVLSGSRSVCLTLWEVDDTATALLMERFYQNLLGKREGLDKPMGKAAALAEAKAWLRTLPRAEAVKRASSLSEGVARGKRPEFPPLEVAPSERPTATEAKGVRPPFAHPHYWAAFVLIGHAD